MVDILKNLPTILSYFLPGYIGLMIFLSLSGVKFHEYEKYPLACAISYCIVGLINTINGTTVSISTPVSIWVFILATIISLFLGYGGAILFQSKRFRDFLKDKLRYSPASDTWEGVFDYERGSQILIKMKNGKYIRGQIAFFGNIPSDPWIALSDYDIITADRMVELEADTTETRLIVNTNDIEYADIAPIGTYDKDNPIQR